MQLPYDIVNILCALIIVPAAVIVKQIIPNIDWIGRRQLLIVTDSVMSLTVFHNMRPLENAIACPIYDVVLLNIEASRSIATNTDVKQPILVIDGVETEAVD